ncbi:hypothetical protein [Actinophytocola oryzae]|uniref:Integral membrane protein n=1 Tax=Actinophytocola oryzae TaxID=502181 RepID=A0A4R7VRN8_9PSEU|nr:hypothetical protein [Actinophytocola oryzae]TDV52476.1 hypothetical protein CLV71_105608 [Actinophytocola oryzae]
MRLDADAPRTVRIAGAVIGLQGLVGLVFAVVLAFAPGTLTSKDRFGEAGFFALMAAAVIGFGVALVLGRRGARSPAVVVQLILIGIAGYVTVPSGQAAYGIPIAIVCIGVLYLLLNPAARTWVMGREDPD